MLVYKKDKLKREVIPVSKELFKLRLNHLDSKMSIETDFDINKPSSGIYRVFKEVDGKYVIYQEFLPSSIKSKLDNFKDAIDFFESQILEELREKPQNTQTPPNQQQDEPETFTKTPEVGDIVMVQGNYGRVVDVDGTNVKMKTLTKEEAMKILREQRNQLVQETIDKQETSKDLSQLRDDLIKQGVEGAEGTLQDVVDAFNFELGGDVSTIKEYDASKFKFTIFEVKPPMTPQEPDADISPQDPPDEQEPQPDNIIDPFEDENDSSGENDSDNESTEDETKNDEQEGTEEQEGDEGSGEEEGDEGSGEEEGDEGSGEEEGDDSDDDGDRTDGEESEEENDLEEDEFGNDGNSSEPDLEKIMEEVIEEIKKGKELEDIKINNDIEAIERALNITRRKLKNQFKNPSLAIVGIGNEQIFNTQNKERITKAINKIFE